MKREYVIEFIGTFFLVYTIALTGNPLAIGIVLITLVYMGGSISGAHYNPAVTAALFLLKKIKQMDMMWYMLMQLLGSMAASWTAYQVSGKLLSVTPGTGVTPFSAGIVEALGTFLLVIVILQVAVAKKNSGNQYFGFAIGAALMVMAFAGGAISGGAFNPAVGIGATIMNPVAGAGMLLLLYLIGPMLGGVVAAKLFSWLER